MLTREELFERGVPDGSYAPGYAQSLDCGYNPDPHEVHMHAYYPDPYRGNKPAYTPKPVQGDGEHKPKKVSNAICYHCWAYAYRSPEFIQANLEAILSLRCNGLGTGPGQPCQTPVEARKVDYGS